MTGYDGFIIRQFRHADYCKTVEKYGIIVDGDIMKDIYAESLEREQTAPDKRTINQVFTYNVIHYVIGGSGFFNGRRLNAGQAFLCKKGKYCSYHPDPADPWEYVYLKLAGEDAESFLSRYEAQGDVLEFEPVEKLVQMVTQLCPENEQAIGTEYGTALYYFLRSLHRDHEETPEEAVRENRYVKLAKEYMCSNLCEPLTMEQLAGRLHISRAYLRNLFAESEGISPKQYLIRLRMYHAEQLLLKSNLQITEVARSVGYSDVLQFIKAFHKYHGEAPGEYRQRRRK